jgi:hypothetical protein
MSIMNPLLLSAALLIPADVPDDWKFVDEATHDGRSVLTFRSVELFEVPSRPLDPADKPPAGSKFGSLALGSGGRRRLGVVWRASTNTLWFDANGDGRFGAGERHTLGDKPVEFKVTIPFDGGTNRERTVLIRKRGDGLAWAVRGYTIGSVTIQGRKVAAMLTDGDADGCFDGAGVDRIWLDLDGTGKFDALTEQFPLGTAVSTGGTSMLFRPRRDGLGVLARERPSETGTMSVEIARESKSPIVEFSASYVSEFGELLVFKSVGKPVSMPAGKYRIDSLQFGLADADGRVWQYSFNPSGHEYDIEVKVGKYVVHKPIDGLKVTVSLDAVGTKPGDSVLVRADVVAGDLFMSQCTVVDKFSVYSGSISAEITLSETGSEVLDQCETGFA